jgi:inhibitor of KinA sporulation pathway (predicted exonuclease)
MEIDSPIGSNNYKIIKIMCEEKKKEKKKPPKRKERNPLL